MQPKKCNVCTQWSVFEDTGCSNQQCDSYIHRQKMEQVELFGSAIEDLQNINVRRHGDGWIVTRSRRDNGESKLVADLNEAFRYVSVVYDKDGKARK